MSLDAKLGTLQGIGAQSSTQTTSSSATQTSSSASPSIFPINIGNNVANAYMNSGQRLGAYLAWEHDFLNPKPPVATYTPQAQAISPQQLATLGFLEKEVMKLHAQANSTVPMPMYGDSLPYGMTRQPWMFPFDMYTGGILQPMNFTGMGLGMSYNPFMMSNLGTVRVPNKSNVRVGASVSTNGIGSLLGMPFNAVGGALQGLGDGLLGLAGWNCSS